jgi:transcriptional regulator with XRE-family HTH domain
VTEIAQPTELNLAEKLQTRTYRQQFFLAEASASIAKQLIALRKRRGLDQGQLAEQIGTQQPAISRIEKADYQNWSFNTLRKIAAAEDARIRVSIEAAEDILKEYELQSESLPVVTCNYDSAFDTLSGQANSITAQVIPVATQFYGSSDNSKDKPALHESTWAAVSSLASSRYSLLITHRIKSLVHVFDEKDAKIAQLEAELAAARKENEELKADTDTKTSVAASPPWQIWKTMQSDANRGIPI